MQIRRNRYHVLSTFTIRFINKISEIINITTIINYIKGLVIIKEEISDS